MHTSHGDGLRTERLQVYARLISRFGFERVTARAERIGRAISKREASEMTGDMVAARAVREGRDVVSLVCCLWTEWGEVAIISKLREQEVTGVSDEDLSVLLQCGSGRLLYSLAKHARDMELLTVEMLTAPVMVPMFARTV